MNKKIIRRSRKGVYKLWIKALRSGEYKQGRKALKVGDRFCCLGVLCDLAAKDGGPDWERPLMDSADFFEGFTEILPGNFRKFMGLEPRHLESLVDRNDEQKHSFCDIANYIENNLAH